MWLFGHAFGAVTSSFRRASIARLSTSPRRHAVERPRLGRPRNGPAYSVQGMPCARRPLIQRGSLSMHGALGCPCLVRCQDTSITYSPSVIPRPPSDPRRSSQTPVGPSRERLMAELLCGSRSQSHNPAAVLAFGVVLRIPQIHCAVR